MAKYVILALTNPTEGNEDEFNRWYDESHIADVIDVPGFVSARRFRLADRQYQQNRTPNKHRYLALYEIETDDLDATLDELYSRVGTPAMLMSDAIELDGLHSPVFEQFAGPIMADDVRRERARTAQPV
jgi:hypothetical protein